MKIETKNPATTYAFVHGKGRLVCCRQSLATTSIDSSASYLDDSKNQQQLWPECLDLTTTSLIWFLSHNFALILYMDCGIWTTHVKQQQFLRLCVILFYFIAFACRGTPGKKKPFKQRAKNPHFTSGLLDNINQTCTIINM